MIKAVTFLFAALFTTFTLAAQTVKTQTKTCTKTQTWIPENWVVTAWQNVRADDNLYIKSKVLNNGGLGGIYFSNFGFSIPTGATIQKVEANIIRFKSGKNNVYEQTVAILKAINDTEACGGSPNMASKDPWTDYEKNMLYSFPVGGSDCQSQSFIWTPQEVNKAMFGLLLQPYMSLGGRGEAVLIEQVTITVYYTEQSRLSIQSSSDFELKSNIDIRSYNKTVVINTPQIGKYRLTVIDSYGRIIQQANLRTGITESIPLNANCKGYCIIYVEGNGMIKTLKTYIQQ